MCWKLLILWKLKPTSPGNPSAAISRLFFRNPASFNISLAPPPLLQALMFRVQCH